METAAVYWRKNILPPTGRAFIVAEAFHDDIRVTLRNLTVANALRRLIPAHLVVLTGVDEMWQRALNHSLNVHRVLELAEAYGATEVFDLHALVDHQLATEGREELRLSVAGHELPRPRRIPRITPAELDLNTVATLCRLELVPRLEEGWAQDPAYLDRRRRGAVLSAIYDHLFGSGDAVAFVTSHVDYDQWGLGVLAAQRAGVPVINPQSTGSLKAYTLFPETARGEVTFRAELTRQIGAAFERDVWPQRHGCGNAPSSSPGAPKATSGARAGGGPGPAPRWSSTTRPSAGSCEPRGGAVRPRPGPAHGRRLQPRGLRRARGPTGRSSPTWRTGSRRPWRPPASRGT